jgi:hypothetical protein
MGERWLPRWLQLQLQWVQLFFGLFARPLKYRN